MKGARAGEWKLEGRAITRVKFDETEFLLSCYVDLVA